MRSNPTRANILSAHTKSTGISSGFLLKPLVDFTRSPRPRYSWIVLQVPVVLGPIPARVLPPYLALASWICDHASHAILLYDNLHHFALIVSREPRIHMRRTFHAKGDNPRPSKSRHKRWQEWRDWTFLLTDCTSRLNERERVLQSQEASQLF